MRSSAVQGAGGAPGRTGAAGAAGVPGAAGAPGGPPSGPAGGALTGSFPNPMLALGSVGASQLASSAVSNTAVASNAINTRTIASRGVWASDLQAVPSLDVWKSGNDPARSVATATPTPISFDRSETSYEDGAVGGSFSSASLFSLPQAGSYLVSVSVRWDTTGTGPGGAGSGFRALELHRIVGSTDTLVASSRIASAPDGYTDQGLEVRLNNVATTDQLRLVGIQDSGRPATLSTLGSRAAPRLQATWVAST